MKIFNSVLYVGINDILWVFKTDDTYEEISSMITDITFGEFVISEQNHLYLTDVNGGKFIMDFNLN